MAFTETELNRSLRKPRYQLQAWIRFAIMINHLCESSKDVLLKMYQGKLPQSWKETVIVPICKPGKDCTNPGNYRPIALTSNICKIWKKQSMKG